MSHVHLPGDPLKDAQLAIKLLQAAPQTFGGISLRGSGPVRDALVDRMRCASTVHRLPPSISDDALLGGIDLAASLSLGKTIAMPGLLDKARGAMLLAAMAERMQDTIAGRLAQALDTDVEAPALILLDDGLAHDERPPGALLERIAFHCDLSNCRSLPGAVRPVSPTAAEADAISEHDAIRSLAQTAMALGIPSMRPLNFALAAARMLAALASRQSLIQDDIAYAARLVLASRATQLPAPAQDQPDPAEHSTNNAPPDHEPDHEPDRENAGPKDHDNEQDRASSSDTPPEDIVLEAALSAIPPDILKAMAQGTLRRGGSGSAAGKKRKSPLRGRPLGTRNAAPRAGARLALVDTLRAAVPWQAMRRGESVSRNSAASNAVIVRREDLRIRRFEERAGTVTIFAVDASGSAAFTRLAEAKGAVELMLAQAHVTRSEVALISFRGKGAQLLLEATRSLTRARRILSDLPGGGGTPLAAGLSLAHEAGLAAMAKGRTPLLVILTDGRANIAADGTASRKRAAEDTQTAARAIARTGLDSLVIDIAARPSPDAGALARQMHGQFLALPRADAKALHHAVTAIGAKAAA